MYFKNNRYLALEYFLSKYIQACFKLSEKRTFHTRKIMAQFCVDWKWPMMK